MRSERRRLHPAAWVVNTLASLREAVVPAIAALLLSGRGLSGASLIAVLAVGLSAFAGYLRWQRTAYWIDDDALHFVSGVFSPDHKTVPLARITAVDEIQGLVQRAFGVVALHVQTAGGAAQGEVVLSAVAGHEAARLREALGRDAAPDERDEPDWRLSGRALAVAAVTGPQIGVVAPIVAGAAGLLQQAAGGDDIELLERLRDLFGGWEMLAAAALGTIVALSLAGAVVAFGGFSVYRDPRRLRLRRGVLQRRAASIGIERVHAVRIVEGAVRRPLGLCAIRLEVAGYAKEASAAQTLVPLCRRRDADALLARLVPELPVPAGAPRRPPRRATRRYVIGPALVGAALGALAAGFVAPLAGLVAGLLAGAAVGLARARAAAWWLDGATVAMRRHHVLARSTTVAAAPRLQHTEASRSPLQARAGLATIAMAVASGHVARVAHLEARDAEDLFARLRRYAGAGEPSSRATSAA